MDADYKEKRRERFVPEKLATRQSFSMDPQRFDDILAEITTGYANIRNSFENVNIAEILEEMVTEFARAALEGAEARFTELAVLLQHCAALYGRKVDFLHRHVLDVCELLAPAAEAAPARRRRAASTAAAAAFAHLPLEPCAAANRARAAPRPPPTLPRMYAELQPAPAAPHAAPLTDDAGEPVGAPADFHVTRRLRHGFLLDDLEAAPSAARAVLRPLSLLELQSALAAAAPKSPPRAPPSPESARGDSPPPDLASPTEPATPGPATPPPTSPVPATPPPAPLAPRKRKNVARLTDIADVVDSPIKMMKINGCGARAEFSPPEQWVRRVVAGRARRLLLARAELPAHAKEFRGFEDVHPETGGFPGWSAAEALEARGVAAGAALRGAELDSDDDGFFDSGSFSSLDSSRASPPPAPAAAPAPAPAPRGEAARAADAAWSAAVAARAAAAEARGGVDMRALGGAVLRALPPQGALPFPALLRQTAARAHDVSRLLLATLFLANSGNVDIVREDHAPPGDFSVALLDADERRFAAAAEAEAQLLAPPPPPPPPA